MRSNLWVRLTLAFVFVALVGVVLVAVLANRATAVGFARYLQSDELGSLERLQDELNTFYSAQSSWNGANSLLRDSEAGPQGGGGGYFLRVLDIDGQIVASRGGQARQQNEFEIDLPLVADGEPVGRLLAAQAGGGGRAGEQYLSWVNQSIVWSGLAALLIALFLGLLLARRLTLPLGQLTAAARDVATGDLTRRVEVAGSDEMGQLAQDFNRMAAALELSEQQRRQMLADTAHDLRTPLSVMRSHLEAMLDGVFPMTSDNLAAIHEETLYLSRLVEDVRVLSLAESGHLPLQKAQLDLRSLVDQVVNSFAPLAEADGVLLSSNLNTVDPIIADEARIHQVLANLISNALRYAVKGSKAPATVSVTLEQDVDTITITVEDSGPGLTAGDKQRVFERFWHGDLSQDRRQSGSGLGLAISKSIVLAHDGTIGVESSEGAGSRFTVTLPRDLEAA